MTWGAWISVAVVVVIVLFRLITEGPVPTPKKPPVSQGTLDGPWEITGEDDLMHGK